MKLLDRVLSTPMTLRVPLLVAALMVVVSAVISERVLDRLHGMQEQQLDSLVTTYFDGLTTALMPAVLRQDIWETYDVLDRTHPVSNAVSPVETIVTGRDGTVLASTDPRRVPALSALPIEYQNAISRETSSIDWEGSRGFGYRPLRYQGKIVGAISASFDIAHFVQERREIIWTLLATNGVLALFFAAAGYALTRRMVKPVTTLAQRMKAGAAGLPSPFSPDEFPRRGELAELFHGFNALIAAEREKRDLLQRLAEEEKLASLGRLASSMAHEINNPLGGLFNSIDTLRRHGANEGVRETTLSLLERGLGGIRDVVRATLAAYRPDRAGRPLLVQDLDDVRILAGPAIDEKGQTLDWSVEAPASEPLPVPGHEIRQALLNLVLNASAAAGRGGRVAVEIRHDRKTDELSISVNDTGPGFDHEASRVLTAPGAPQPSGGGLGLWMVRRMVDAAGGRVEVGRASLGGAKVEVWLPAHREEERHDAA
ncbi:HAMP domain-containing sensor histidine kinase [Rhizobium laguerreae]